MSVLNPNRLGDECYRTVCIEVATAGPHRDLGTYYCQGCAMAINRANPIANSPLIPGDTAKDHDDQGRYRRDDPDWFPDGWYDTTHGTHNCRACLADCTCTGTQVTGRIKTETWNRGGSGGAQSAQRRRRLREDGCRHG